MKPFNDGDQSDGNVDGAARRKAAGTVEGKQESVLLFLRARGFVVSEADEARIRACTDVDAIDHWLKRAVSARAVDEVFQ